jgi:hypothetical protein
MIAFFMEERSPILGPVVVVLGNALLLPILALGNWIHLFLELDHPTTYIALGIHSLFYGSATAFVWRWLRRRRRRVRIGAIKPLQLCQYRRRDIGVRSNGRLGGGLAAERQGVGRTFSSVKGSDLGADIASRRSPQPDPGSR